MSRSIFHFTDELLTSDDFMSTDNVGRAGEYLVAAELEMCGLCVTMAAEGMPYDLIVDVDGRIVRVQVKTTKRKQKHKGTWRYRFKLHNKKYGAVDMFALVALDCRGIVFLSGPEHSHKRWCEVKVDGYRGLDISLQTLREALR